ncbi:flavin-containing monooxygenase [Mycolicibacterium aubagnense]|uniref:Monooxygenase n=1 Tax=Mycolicibacterium aubagnense TaxID=319707 RepID=A0ABM7I707_9MYCO|nr:NAD(P)/FAD-dependent oxidoreductase [Mycolicibacterium aubagnense]TLH64111.1 NAD(P)/FAD-dependent oxidoreductase [Mycolicibacterium aubagnense]WGI30723.1 NAD(P)/FAD-dependent oxidoreductase [Mycolicibacterium aubagnense]BBX82341.1 putative monooxygenase [Mycolicibacterium aubagnense]
MTTPDHEVVIIGAGPGGIASAHLLQEKGIHDFVIVDRGDDFGGTWRDNHYPGLAVDIPSLWYQLSFAPNPNWSRFFAPGPEIYAYLRDTADKLGLRPHLRGNSEVVRQQWDDDEGIWRLSIRDQPDMTARFLISSVGGYVNAKNVIDIDGIGDFEGTIMRPNAWDDDYDVRGKRVAVIGTGSSGVQITGALSGVAANLDVYQRTPAWVLPKVDFDIPLWLRRLLKVPGFVGVVNAFGRLLMDAAMVAPIIHVFSRLPRTVLTKLMPLYDGHSRNLYRLLLRSTVQDPATRKALLPRYGIMAKRPVISSDFLPALNHPDTHLITTPIERITRDGVRTIDGVDRPADLLVTATGYELWTDPETYRPGTIMGSNGFDLAQYYHAHGLHAYAGTAHPRLPNRWEIVGPLGFVGFAWMDYVETVAAHAVRLIDEARRRAGAPVVAVSNEAFNRWNALMDRRGRTAHTYYTRAAELNTYFVNSQHETPYYRPQTITGSRIFARRSPLTDYEFTAVQAATISEELSA